MPDRPTVSNSSCLIALQAVEHLHILERLYGMIGVPDAVAQECGEPLPEWIEVHTVQNRSLVQSLKLELGAGEAEAIALALEHQVERLILDDRKARRIARQFDIPVTGTLAILLRAKDEGVIAQVRGIIDSLLAVNFRISNALIQEVLDRAGE